MIRIYRNAGKAASLILVCLLVGLALAEDARADGHGSDFRNYQTQQEFTGFLDRLKKAIAAQKMGVVAEACADCGARSIGVTIPGNRVVMIFHPRFAVRMLKASLEAGYEAPLRLYVTERPEGAHLSFRMASDVFAPYATSGDLVAMAKELDKILLRIADQATR